MFLQRKSGAAPTWRGFRLQMVPSGQRPGARGPRGGSCAHPQRSACCLGHVSSPPQPAQARQTLQEHPLCAEDTLCQCSLCTPSMTLLPAGPFWHR